MSCCSICLSNINLALVFGTTTKCNHKFHKRCLNTWLSEHDNCPMCRTKLNDETTLTTPTPRSTPTPSLSQIQRINIFEQSFDDLVTRSISIPRLIPRLTPRYVHRNLHNSRSETNIVHNNIDIIEDNDSNIDNETENQIDLETDNNYYQVGRYYNVWMKYSNRCEPQCRLISTHVIRGTRFFGMEITTDTGYKYINFFNSSTSHVGLVQGGM